MIRYFCLFLISLYLHPTFADITTSSTLIISSNETHTNIIIQSGGVITIQSGVTVNVSYLTVEIGGKIIIEDGAFLDWPSTGNANIRDSVVVRGDVNMQGNIYLENNGVIYVTSTGTFDAGNSGGSLSNSGGKIKIDNGGEMNIESYQNYGGANIEVDGILNVNGDMTNAGTIEGNGVMYVSGTTTNQSGGTIFGDGSSSPDCTSGCGDVSLPVSLLGFSVQVTQEQAAILTWETASEQDNDYFTIEKSYDGRSYLKADQVSGNGTTPFASRYDWRDESSLRGLTYYRLSQTDFDGTTKVIALKAISPKKDASPFSFYPNPVSIGESIFISGFVPDQISLYNQGGQLVGTFRPLDTRVAIPALTPGVYIIKFDSKEKAITKKLIVR